MEILTKELINEILDDMETLIDSNKFTEFYKYLYKKLGNGKAVGEMTSFLLNAGVNPLEYMESVPVSFLDNNKDIEDITIPSNIKKISRNAFNDSALKSVSFEGSIEIIDDFAFEGCTGLTDITLPDGIKTIGDYAFSDTNIKSLTIPTSIKEIGDNVIFGVPKECKVTYLGYPEQWEYVKKPNGNHDALVRKVVCKD